MTLTAAGWRKKVKDKIVKKRGGQAGNQNARKHGFYSRVLTKAEKKDLRRAMEEEGLDGEIALLRVKIKSLAENDPDNVKLFTKALNTLERLLRARDNIGKDDRNRLKEAATAVLRDIALPLGMEIFTRLGK